MPRVAGGITRICHLCHHGFGIPQIEYESRVSAKFEDATAVLRKLTTMGSAAFVGCDLPTDRMSPVPSYKDTTDAYLVSLAREHSYLFATLDEGIMAAPWANGVAFHPFVHGHSNG